MAIGASLISGLGKAAKISSAVGSSLSGRTAMTALAGGAFFAGMANKAGPTAMDAAMETAFGDANADRYFTGRDLSLRTFMGASIGGLGGEMLQMTDSGDYMATSPIMPANPLVSSAAGAGVGTGIGSLAGAAIAKARGKGGIKGALLGGVIGNIAGGIMGGAASASVPLSHMRNNQQFFSQSPYSPMLGTSGNLNATGDIVLGMHNARRGY